ncbi:hypothetical protein [Sphingobacterium spiritivorum]
MKYWFISVCLGIGMLTVQSAHAQKSSGKAMQVWQDSLLSIGSRVFQNPSEPERIDANFKFVKTLVSALKEKNSFDFGFDQLKMISVLNSPDNKFRIFSWNVPLNDGSYLYYGSIQLKTGNGELSLIPLLDKTFEIQQAEQAVVSSSSWYGAQYYEIIQNADHYLLLGWKGHNRLFTQKVIEVLSLKGKEATFGKKLFSDQPQISRKIFNYTRQASMLLRYDAAKKRIVFDHLVPADKSLEGKYQYYGPDLTYDAYEIVPAKLFFKSNIEFTNPVRGDEDQYLNPARKKIEKKSGFNAN